MFGIGAGEFVLILIVGLIVFGPSKLPEFGRSLGKLIRELKKTQATLSNAINLDEPPTPAAATTSPSQPQEPSQASSQPQQGFASTEQLTQLANSNPIRLDKADSTSKEQRN